MFDQTIPRSVRAAEISAVGKSIFQHDPKGKVASEDDSLNLMAAQIAKSLFQREKVICRVSDPHLQVLYHKAYELDTICPTVLTEQAVFRSLAK